MKNYKFYKSLHARGVKLDALAEELGTTTSQLSMVFNNQRGGHTRKHIVKHLTPAELELLGWDEKGHLLPSAEEQVRKRELAPRGTSSH